MRTRNSTTILSYFLIAALCIYFSTTTRPAVPMTATAPKTRDEWRKALDDLPSSPEKIPAFFFAHSSPMMLMPSGKDGPLAQFLRDFGETLVRKYKPKAIVVFSAHWETNGARVGTQWSNLALGVCVYACGRSQ